MCVYVSVYVSVSIRVCVNACACASKVLPCLLCRHSNARTAHGRVKAEVAWQRTPAMRSRRDVIYTILKENVWPAFKVIPLSNS